MINRSLVGTLITVGDVTVSIAIGVIVLLLVYRPKQPYACFCKDGKNVTIDSEEELFLTQSSFNGSSNRGNELEKFVSLNNRQVDHEYAQFNVEEATEGLFSFDHSDEHQEVSIGSVEKETVKKEGHHSR